MKRKIEFSPVNLQGIADIYSIRIDDDRENEFRKFLVIFKPEQDQTKQEKLYKDDYYRIVEGINQISQKGALDRFFRYEGKYKDRVFAIPTEILRRDKKKYGTLRLYCLRISDRLLIIGSGGKKTVDTYQKDRTLDNAVKTLQAIDKELNKLEKDGTVIEDIIQNLVIYID